MKPADSSLELHVFVCTNKKPSGECCALKSGVEFRKELKNRISARPELKDRVRINSAGCLDKCEEGIACVIYPEGEWFTDVAMADLDRFEQMITEKLSAT